MAGPRPGSLDRRFEALLFDWEGTAVPDRRADATEVRRLVEALCALGATGRDSGEASSGRVAIEDLDRPRS